MSSASRTYKLISVADSTGVEAYTLLFAYAGFNPEMVHAHFDKILNDKGIGEAEFIDDMRALITLGALKGNYTLRNAGKISDEGRERADAMYKKYEMKQGSLSGDKKAIILPRVLSAYPELTTKVIMKTPPRDFGLRTSKLPNFMKNPVFASLIPKKLESNARQTLLWLYTVYSADQSLVISAEKDFNIAYGVQSQFVTIAFNSSVPSEEMRTSIFKAALEEIVLAVNNHKDLTDGVVPQPKCSTTEMRAAINKL